MTGAPGDPIEIDGDDELYRRIVSFHVNPDGTVNSAAFELRDKTETGLSVDVAKLTSAEECLARAGVGHLGLATLVARVPRSLGMTVRHDPKPDNVAHAQIEGENTKAKRRALAQAAAVLVPPAARQGSR